jgi:ribose transport system permease protein
MGHENSTGRRPRGLGALTANAQLYLLLGSIIVLLFLIGQAVAGGFLTLTHAGSVLRTAAFLGIVAIGQTLVILIAGIDISVGAVITMGNVLACMMINGSNAATIWAVPAVLAIGATIGLFNGVLIAYAGIHPMVMTLASGSLTTGMVLIVSKGAPKGLASPVLQYVATRSVGGLPLVVGVWLLLSIGTVILLAHTTYGRRVYFLGANERTAFLSGVRTRRVMLVAYIISGVSAALTGTLMAGYTQTAFLGIGNEYTLWSIAAVVVGGTALSGGKGGYVGTFLGAVILALLESVLTVVRMPEAGRQIANGLIIILMIAVHYSRERRR